VILLLALPGNDELVAAVASALNRDGPWVAEVAKVTLRQFPDGESYVRIEAPVRGREVAVVCTLDRPDSKILPLLFVAATVRDLGADSVGIIAPYLAYMRQDRRFIDGEGVTSSYFASLISSRFDWLVTVDPHLHRHGSLAEVYSIASEVVHAAPRVADWIRAEVREPLLIGPDEESAQWVGAVAERAAAPFLVLEKVRHGDRDVSVTVPDLEQWRARTPVLVDDIISTARTMIETVGHVRRAGLASPVCVAVHAVFAGNAYDELLAAGAMRVVSCNTISHPSNAIDLSDDLARAVLTVLRGSGEMSHRK
jgi:ribose-phosphate pyrophosphokinase